jgi:hypothetical protein
MAQRRRAITVTAQDKARLDRYKKTYEAMRGLPMTWGQFLVSVACLGMAAAYIEQIKGYDTADSAS